MAHRPDLLRRALAEAAAVFVLVFAGCSAIIANVEHINALGVLGVSAAFGLVVMAMVYAVGPLSGAHLNPAVTIAFTLTRRFPLGDAAAYIAAQLAGATAGALVLLAAWSAKPAALGATVPGVHAGTALLYEALMTAFLMFVVLAVTNGTRIVGAAAAAAVGATIAFDGLIGGTLTGASMNPARSFGPALASGIWRDFWIYLVGPILGAIVGALVHQLLRGRPEAESQAATEVSGA